MKLPPPPVGYESLMSYFEEELCLSMVGVDAFGREVQLAEDAAVAWSRMQLASKKDGVSLLLISGYRSIQRQTEIVAKKLGSGLSLEEILKTSAYPGFSEHHTGRAIDFGSPECKHLTEAFENTREFAWLSEHAAAFGFYLSYPRSNSLGLVYEPWHWMLVKKLPSQQPE